MTEKKPSLLQVFANKRMAVTLLLGFSSGLPLALTGSTLQAWMTSEKVDLTIVGIFSLVGLPYTWKFIWAPILDRFVPPFLGRRRGWIAIAQLALIVSIATMGFSNPVEGPGFLAAMALMVAFFSASQDIVIDAYRAEVLKPEELGAGAGLYIMGYRIAMLTSGALALALSDQMPWKTVYFIMAAVMSIGVVTSFFSPEPAGQPKPPKSLREAVVEPLLEYFRRRGAFEMLAFIILYKLGDVVAGSMTTPFMIQLGFTRTDIAAVNKGFGMISTIVGTLAGGALIARMGINRSLWIFGILQAVSNVSFMILARLGQHYPMMVATIGIENFCGGMGTAGFTAFMMSLCNKRFTTTQYALLTSLMAVTRVVISSPTGWMAKNLGWEQYFLVATLLAIPGLLLLRRFAGWSRAIAAETEAAAAATSPAQS